MKYLNIFKWIIFALAACAAAFLFGIKGANLVAAVLKEPTLEVKSEVGTKSAVALPKAVPEKIIIHPKKKEKVESPAPKKSPPSPPKELNDPFRVDFSVVKKGGSEEAEIPFQKTFTLQGVIMSSKRSVALIDDEIVGVGEYIHGWKVVGIKKDRVGLKSKNKTKKIFLNLGDE